MTITFTPSGGSAVTLAGAEADGSDGSAGFGMGAESITQREAVIRGSMKVMDRLNRRTSGGFTVKRLHADYDAGCAHIVAHLAAVAGVGSLVFSWTGGSETLTSAVVTASARSMGATTEWQYTFEGTT